MNRRGFLKFLGYTPAVPIVGRMVKALPAVAPAAAPAVAPVAAATAAAFAYSMVLTMSVCNMQTWENIRIYEED